MKWIVIGAIALVLAFAIYLAMEWFSGPMFRPGQAKVESAPAKVDGDFFVMADGARLYFRTQGQGEPVLMVHGGPGYPFRETWQALEGIPGKRFIYFDQRGCGKSSRTIESLAGTNTYENFKTVEGKLGLAAQLADIDAIRRGLGKEKITLIGHSFGGFLAALYAAEYPEHVQKIVLIAPAAVMAMPAGDDGLYAEVQRRLTDPQDRVEYDTWLKRSFDFSGMLTRNESELSELYGAFMPFWARALGASKAEAAAMTVSDHSVGGFQTLALYLSLGKKHDYRASLAHIMAPTLILTARDDMAGKETIIREQYKGIPNSRLQVIPSASHFIFTEKQGEFTTSLAQFLQSDP